LPTFDVAVVIPTIGRATLQRAVRSIYSQHFQGRIQVLIGVDEWKGDRSVIKELIANASSNCAVTAFDLGYSTATRNGGLHPAGTGGALRTILSYAAHSRHVVYLDDDNWWGPDHLASLVDTITGQDWAYSLRWFADVDTSAPLCVDTWESVGPDAGVFKDRFGGFVDPSCLMIDKIACEPALRLWCEPMPGDPTGMSTDRAVFEYLRHHGRGAATGRATAFYQLSRSDTNHEVRMQLINEVRSSTRATGSGQ
jgi:hypothetical protein